MSDVLVVCDFDGTLIDVDLGHVLLDRFGAPDWRSINVRFHRGEISLPAAQRQMWAPVTASREALTAHALASATLRPGVDLLFEAAAMGRCELVLASAGFDLYIEPILGPRMPDLSTAYYSRLVADPTHGSRLEFGDHGLGCPRCALCKGRVIEHHRAGRRVVFCGDGHSDRCAAARADDVFAIADSPLARHCEAEGIPHTPFDDFAIVAASVGGPISTAR